MILFRWLAAMFYEWLIPLKPYMMTDDGFAIEDTERWYPPR